MLLKPLIIAAGALLTVTLVSNQAASAARYRPVYSPIRHAVYARTFSPRVASRGRTYRPLAYATGIARARTYVPRRFAAAPAFPRRIGLVRGIAAYRTVSRSRFVRGNLFARAEQVIQTLVSPIVSRPATQVGAGRALVGRASYYAMASRTASGGSVGVATCAHRYLPFGTRILVTNLANAHSMVLTVNDRGPFTGGRILDVSRPAAGFLGMLHSGTAPVSIKVVGHS